VGKGGGIKEGVGGRGRNDSNIVCTYEKNKNFFKTNNFLS
jgi:hypothetical protein